jgi:hypothetical protein
MSTLRHAFFDHPRAVNETYLGHLGTAMRFGATLLMAGFACMVHGLVPSLFVTHGSDTVETLHRCMQARRQGS